MNNILTSLIKIDKNVKKVISYITDLLKTRGLYSEALDIQIFNVSCQIIEYNKLFTDLMSQDSVVTNAVRGGGSSQRRNPLIQDITSLSESLRKNLKELGLSLESKAAAVTDSNPLVNMINELKDIEGK